MIQTIRMTNEFNNLPTNLKNIFNLILIEISNLLKIDVETIISLLNDEKKEDYRKKNFLEKKSIILKYYRFLKNQDCLSFIDKSYNNILIEKNIMNNNNLSESDVLNICIIILKSFIDDNSITDVSEKFKNSDDILNYCEDQYNKYNLKKQNYHKKWSVRSFMFCFINMLKEEDLLSEKIIYLSDVKYKTIKNYCLKNVSYVKDISEFYDFSYSEFEVIEFLNNMYITGEHYSKTYELYKKNFYSNKSFKVKKEEYLLKKINLKLYVDDIFQKNLLNIMRENEDFLFNSIREDTTKLNSFYEKDNWNSNTKKKIADLQAEISKKLDRIISVRFCKEDFKNNQIIFPIFLDFRGRKYYSSRISPTSSKILRLSYYYGWYKKEDFNKNFDKFLEEDVVSIIEEFITENNIKTDKIFYNCIYWCLISIGKHFIKKNKFPIKEMEFIKAAKENYENTNIKEEDLIEVLHIKEIIKSLTNENLINGKIKKRGLSKDATASVNQIFMKKIGPINNKSLDYVNLGQENEWYDTYLVHKEMFYEYIKKKNLKEFLDREYFDNIFERKLIKKIIMIIPYSAGEDLCWDNYIDDIKNLKKEIKIDKKLKKIFKFFYKFVKYEMQKEYLYTDVSANIIDEINENFEEFRSYVLESDTGVADISYNKMKKSTIDKKIKIKNVEKRITKLVLEPSKSIDIKSFNSASGPNLAHFLDADELRFIEIELGYCIITIHDCFIIDFNNCDELIQIKQKHYEDEINKKFKCKIKNKFILL